MRLSESINGTGPVAILVRVEGDEAVDRLHQGLVELSRVEEVRCRRYAGGWLLTACGVPNADPDPLLRTVGTLVDQFDSLAEVLDVRLGGSELPSSLQGYPISPRFKVAGGTVRLTLPPSVLMRRMCLAPVPMPAPDLRCWPWKRSPSGKGASRQRSGCRHRFRDSGDDCRASRC